MDNHTACTYDTPRADANSGDDAGTDANQNAVSDLHIAGDIGTRPDVDVIAYNTVMSDGAVGVQDDVVADCGDCFDDSARHQH